jgi:hypothetical protein
MNTYNFYSIFGKAVVCFILALFVSIDSYSQVSSDRTSEFPAQAWFGIQGFFPVGQFANQINKGYGGAIDFGFTINPWKRNNSILQFGMDIGIGYWGKAKFGYDKTNQNLYCINLLTRLTPNTNKLVKPYADILLGGKIFYVATHKNNNLIDAWLNTTDYTVIQDKTSSVWSYGVALGLKFQPKYIEKNHCIDIRFIYSASGPMNYYSPTYQHTRVDNSDLAFAQLSYTYLIKSRK